MGPISSPEVGGVAIELSGVGVGVGIGYPYVESAVSTAFIQSKGPFIVCVFELFQLIDFSLTLAFGSFAAMRRERSRSKGSPSSAQKDRL